jgi:hypothetical protein
MKDAIVVRGRITSPRSVELDEPVLELHGEVEIILRPRAQTSDLPAEGATQSLTEFLHRLPSGTRTRAEIDHQLQDERSGWDK